MHVKRFCQPRAVIALMQFLKNVDTTVRALFIKFLTPRLTHDLASQISPRIMESFSWLVGLIDSSQSSSGLHNSQINPGVKKLMNKAQIVTEKITCIG